jgi:hypothetical protein
MSTPTQTTLVDSKYLTFVYYPDQQAIVATAKGSYIPDREFRGDFEAVLEKLKEAPGANKLIFDKRNLRTFNQQSMTWYHIHWKPKAYEKGITRHVKLLPDDNIFRQSVNVGKEKIIRENPDFDYDKYNIQYKESLEEAFAV